MCGRSNEAVLWAASAFSALFLLVFFIFLLRLPLLARLTRVEEIRVNISFEKSQHGNLVHLFLHHTGS